jgi:hypothetical protein
LILSRVKYLWIVKLTDFYLFSVIYHLFLMPISSNNKIVCGPDKEPLEGPGNSAATDNVAPETLDGRTDGADVYVAETLFSVGKSRSQNGIQVTSERTSGAAGLGEGSPKVCPFFL